MTKAQLIKALADIPDNEEIVISYKDDTEWHEITNIKRFTSHVMLESDENLNMDGMYSMAEAILEEDSCVIMDNDRTKLEDFIE